MGALIRVNEKRFSRTFQCKELSKGRDDQGQIVTVSYIPSQYLIVEQVEIGDKELALSTATELANIHGDLLHGTLCMESSV